MASSDGRHGPRFPLMLDSRVSRSSTRTRASTTATLASTATRARRIAPTASRTGATRASTSTRATTNSIRSVILLLTFSLCASGLIARLAFWQILDHGHLAALAAADNGPTVLSPNRGQITDARGNPLATNVVAHQVYAFTSQVRDPYRTAALLAPILGKRQEDVQKLLTQFSGYILLSRHVNDWTSRRIQSLGLPGIGLSPIVLRAYPQGPVASQVVGFRNEVGAGYGLEQSYDKFLSGKAGFRSVIKDTAGNDIHLQSGPSQAAHAGADLHLTLDSTIQSLVENELKKAVKMHNADGGSIIAMDPRTGYILGMANAPGYDPNHRLPQDSAHFINPAVEALYEPGSTFKIITMAAGLDAHVITPDTAFNDTGAFVVGPDTLHNWNLLGFGYETMTQVLQHSANVGAAWVAQRLGTNAFYKYVKAFHLGQTTGVDLPDEQAGILPLPGQKNWTVVSQYTNAYGQGIAVTPLQMIRAVAAVANHGQLMKPQIVKQIVYDNHVMNRPPVSVGQVISPESARTLTDMLVHSAIGGEAALGLVKGYNIAAKTGTSNVASPNGGYIKNDTIASIVGYAPAFNPRFIILVKIDHPRDTQWGSTAAAPILHNLFQDLFMYYHIPPATNPVNK